MIIHLHVEFLILDPNTNIQKEKLDLTHLIRHAIITEKVNICLTLFEPLPPPYFLLSKAIVPLMYGVWYPEIRVWCMVP